MTSKATRAFIIRNTQLTFLVLSFCMVIWFLPPPQDVQQFHLKMMYLHPAFHSGLIFNLFCGATFTSVCMFSALQRSSKIFTRKFFLKGQPNVKHSILFVYCNENCERNFWSMSCWINFCISDCIYGTHAMYGTPRTVPEAFSCPQRFSPWLSGAAFASVGLTVLGAGWGSSHRPGPGILGGL